MLKKNISTHGYRLYIRKLSDAKLKAKVSRTLNNMLKQIPEKNNCL